jgi:hypothetical protein
MQVSRLTCDAVAATDPAAHLCTGLCHLQMPTTTASDPAVLKGLCAHSACFFIEIMPRFCSLAGGKVLDQSMSDALAAMRTSQKVAEANGTVELPASCLPGKVGSTCQ